MPDSARADLDQIARAALVGVDPDAAVRRAVSGGAQLSIDGRPVDPDSRLVVIAIGKAAAPMARALEDIAGDRIETGLVITKDGHADPPPRMRLLETAHPVPDARGDAAAREALALALAAAPKDVLLVLLSGGASALTACPAEGLTLEDLAETTRALLGCGADIEETNTVRKQLTRLSGGRLAASSGCARIEVLAISDVPGDRLEVIGSGPCMLDPTTSLDALGVLERRGIVDSVPARVRSRLQAGALGAAAVSREPRNEVLARVNHCVIARNADARVAAVAKARSLGLLPIELGEGLSGEACEVGRRLAALACASVPRESPVCFIAGGETTVTLHGTGLGGRNQELALAAALELDRQSPQARVSLLALGTDGTDGPTDAAGAFADRETVARGARAGADAGASLRENDSYRFFDREGGLLRTGPTGTNVMDLAFVHVGVGE